ncbi:MAG TPA: hypothetical protein VND70_00340 [Acidimicrobiales bacterium]|nr:hypothetical protein [Acidimicrobiales bacterium]
MEIGHEMANYELMLELMVQQEQHDYQVMLEIRDQSVGTRSLTGVLVAEDWLERHGMEAGARRTCGTCLTWSEGHVHQAVEDGSTLTICR